MRRSETKGISDLIQAMKKQYRLENGLNQASIIRSWESVVGPAISSYTDHIYFRGQTLYVHLRSPILRHELNGQRDVLRKRLNESIKSNYVQEIVLK